MAPLKGKHLDSSGIRSAFDCLFAHLQLQNSRMVIQERDRVIKELEEKVAFLEAEVRAASPQRNTHFIILNIVERDQWLLILTFDLLFAQNREMHDRMEYFLGGERSNSYLSSERNAQIVYR